ncbi:MAG: alanine--tRNA ligase, partial [Acidobacteriota bacterium]|nr:alanine--tRNA ligase [Acidobacteriota bacterium]
MSTTPAGRSSDAIREQFLAFYEERGHLRIPSASLVPSEHDPSALLTVAGMHPLKPYFLGVESPPAPRLTDCQKCFRTVDIEQVGRTNRHLTFFEMLGNFSIGDYFKREAIAFAWELSLEVFRFDPNDIWVTVFAGDPALSLGPDDDAIGFWEAVGVPAQRIVRCPRSENFWQAGPTGPCGPCSELYLDLGADHGSPDDLPGGENERFLEYWNLVFMQYDQGPPDTLAPLPARNIDTGLGLNRLAAILQGKDSVFETDQFWPLIELGQDLSGAAYGASATSDRALRLLADHARATTFLLADGVVPSNEDRGYVLRRVMRRAIHQGRVLGMAPGFLLRYAEVVRELMGGAYAELLDRREAVDMWLSAEEESFSRTLEQGLQALRGYIQQARSDHRDAIGAEDAFSLHDTSGFPFDLTRELLAEEGLDVDAAAFERLMDAQRSRARAAAAGAAAGAGVLSEPAAIRAAAVERLQESAAAPTSFTGYESEQEATTVLSAVPLDPSPERHRDGDHAGAGGAGGAGGAANGGAGGEGTRRLLVKLADSPFYAVGGGQVSDVGVLECADHGCRARVEGVIRLGADQALEVTLEQGRLEPNVRVLARVDHAARHATQCNHTATHLLHAALRARLGSHVRQAGSYVGPDKLRFDFNHTSALSPDERADVEDQVNDWIARNDPVSAVTTTREEAERLGAMALFGEKYGDVVRMVEVGSGEYSRELCGGTHVRLTGEIGAFVITAETSSAANVRRIEALTGPAAVAFLRRRSRAIEEIAAELRSRPEDAVEGVRRAVGDRRRMEKAARGRGGAQGSLSDDQVRELIAGAEALGAGDDVRLLAAAVPAADAASLAALADRIRAALPGAAIVLGTAGEERANLLVSVDPGLVKRGLLAPDVVRAAA